MAGGGGFPGNQKTPLDTPLHVESVGPMSVVTRLSIVGYFNKMIVNTKVEANLKHTW